jgi:hypothetical protein
MAYYLTVQNQTFSNFSKNILDVAPNFSTTTSQFMEIRETNLRVLSDHISNLLLAEDLDTQALKVDYGGRQSNYSPVCWIRIYDPKHAPTAQHGYYVVLLFAADGSAVYLSLNQGTSEFRSGAMRPISNESTLLNKAAVARTRLNEWSSNVMTSGSPIMDLRGESVNVGKESKKRIRNYEFANIYSYKYSIDALPTDDVFKDDLNELLVLLWALEDTGSTTATDFIEQLSTKNDAEGAAPPSSKQGRQMDAKLRKLIEIEAENQTIHFYTNAGWTVERVGQLKLGYDLLCKTKNQELHVEVKGTTGQGASVTLTPNEVDHCRKNPDSALAVVSMIKVENNQVVAGSGKLELWDPWVIIDSQLTPSEFSYRLST